MPEEKEFADVVFLLKQVVRNQEKMNGTLDDLLNLFKRYDIEEVIHSEELREG